MCAKKNLGKNWHLGHKRTKKCVFGDFSSVVVWMFTKVSWCDWQLMCQNKMREEKWAWLCSQYTKKVTVGHYEIVICIYSRLKRIGQMCTQNVNSVSFYCWEMESVDQLPTIVFASVSFFLSVKKTNSISVAIPIFLWTCWYWNGQSINKMVIKS